MRPTPITISNIEHWTAELTSAAIAAGVAITVALALHWLLFALLHKVARLSQLHFDELVVERLREPVRWSLIAIAISVAAEQQPTLLALWQMVDRFLVPALLGWVAFALVKAFQLTVERNAVLAQDPLAANSRRTRVAILSRTLGFLIVFVTVALMLLRIPEVRQVGATLLASAGLVGLAVGAAAQPALKSLIAGIQMALTEPIRIDDLVTIDGENGRVEDIRMTYVVIVTPDERRVIVPTIKFLETTFQNWTRVGSGISGSVTLAVRPATPIAPLREAYLQLLAERPEWDQRRAALNVAEAKVDAIELTLVMSARDPAALAALRPAMREAMLEWLRDNCPEALAAVG